MCGIVGYIGNKMAEKQLLESLKKLEYRGYDSSGIAQVANKQIILTKAVGNISCLEKELKNINSSYGIAHTRWATHGKASINNAHPHTSQNGEWAVVHNGIIENFSDIKQSLQKKYSFYSQTDTEIIAKMLEDCQINSNIKKIIDVCNNLTGSFALAIINKNVKDTIYLAKRKSPLYVAMLNNEVFIASDPICFAGKTNTYYKLQDNEFCEANTNKLVFYNKVGKQIKKAQLKLLINEEYESKQGHSHYMLKEILETPKVLNQIAKTYSNNLPFLQVENILPNIKKVVFVGCGTAYHAGLMGAKYIENIAKIESRCYVASEFRYSKPIIDNNTLAIFVSQSGETADTIGAHDLAKKMGATTIALTNVLYSTLAQKTNYIFPTCAGPEIAVASTKAYTAQIAILNMFAKFLSNVINKTKFNFISNIKNIANKINITINENLKELCKQISNQNNIFFIGRGFDYISCEEASLKLKEITYINTQAYPAGELKHGFLALVEKGTYVFVLATQKNVFEKTLNGAFEAESRGAKIILATQFDVPKASQHLFHSIISLPKFKEDLMPISTIVNFQLISYLTSIEKGINPDQPRNLAKSVTVE